MDTLVIQHIACEPPGVYEDVLRERGVSIERVELDDGDPLPDWQEFDAVHAGTPFWGVCLGAQLLAASLGGRVYAGAAPEVGLLPVTLTQAALDDPVFAGVPSELVTLQWHGDTFDLPRGAELLATSPTYAHQAFRWGRTAYGLQFHLEVSNEMAKEWADVPAYAAALERVLGPGSLETLTEELEARADEMGSRARRIFERWLDVSSPRELTSRPAP